MSQKSLGSLIALAGLALLAVSALADQLGIGKEGFGGNQVKGTIGGAVAMILGIALAVFPQKEA